MSDTLGFFSFHFNEPFTYCEYRVRNQLYGSASAEVRAEVTTIGFINYAMGFLIDAHNEFDKAEKALLKAMEEDMAESPEIVHNFDDTDKTRFTYHYGFNATGRASYELERKLSAVLGEDFVLGERISLLTGLLIDEFPGIWGFNGRPKGKKAQSKIRTHLAKEFGEKTDELRRQEEWRNKHVHQQSWFVAAIGMPWVLTFSNQYLWDGWVAEEGEMFTAKEVKASNMALIDFAHWWMTTAMTQTDCLPEGMDKDVRGGPMDLPVIPRIKRV